MINLMPTDEKTQIHAARINVVLFRYIIIALCSFGFLLLALGFSYYILQSIQASAQAELNGNKTQVQATSQASAQVQQLQTSLIGAADVLNASTNYTKLLENLGGFVPSGVVVDSLDLKPTTFGTPTTLRALAKTNGGATDFQAKLQASPFFSAVSLQSIASGGSSDPAYPVVATFSVTMNRGIAQ
jgi:Tfp pilus assembly protein PilN